tara:strand:- start:1812 stop:2477 length:666 start_codon:yes stop_codon:yes gene_type:complete
MALSTYSELKSAIANWLNRTDLTDEIADDFIKLTEADFNAKLRIRPMEQIDTITIDSETETVPTGFIAVRSFYILLSSVKYPLEYITPHNLFEVKGGSTTARPRAYTIESDNETETFRFGPSPDTSYTGYLSYYKAISALSVSNTSNWMLANHPAVYLYGSLYHAANFLGGIDQTQLGQWLQMYSTALERCENNDRQDSYGGAPVVQRTDVQTDLSFYRNR